MTTEEKLDKLTDLVGDIGAGLGSLANSVAKISDQVASHDEQIGILLELTDRNTKNIDRLSREWQAYLTTIHSRQ